MKKSRRSNPMIMSMIKGDVPDLQAAGSMSTKPTSKKPTKAEKLERERAEQQAYYRELEARLNRTMRPVVDAIIASRAGRNKKSPTA